MTCNDLATWLLRSRFSWMLGGGIMLVEVIGRKSGRTVRLPVNFLRDHSDLWVISSRGRVWWRNLKDHSQAVLWICGKPISARGKLVLDDSVVMDRLARICASNNRMAQTLHVGLDEKKVPITQDLQRVARERMFVRFIPVP